MIHRVKNCILRPPEPSDIEALYVQKNDPEIASMLGGFCNGYSHADLTEWIENHRKNKQEILWAINEEETGSCLGHVGFYNIDFRIRAAEYGIMIGKRSAWGHGLGRAITLFSVLYGFNQLNLNRIYLSLLETNQKAYNLYISCGMKEEGRLRNGQYKDGKYIDVILMSILRSEQIQ